MPLLSRELSFTLAQGGLATAVRCDVVLRLLFSRRRTGARTDAITMAGALVVVHWLAFTSAYY